ncbi:hypothetical protein Ln9_0044 [Leuconostoc phage Ln-9]|uniref:Uncharacterized protein n=1 Tax=Leuconostoc phage Ln-9 TaxID=1536605 RepID=A0A0D3MK11_9CAUD|nr:hypothetical protein ACQ47_gp44 [Leuconostoc phage Ln-9]AIM50893.1 hypothetical protein Ln9_0044 [Leuconostoc phage Ln-9]
MFYKVILVDSYYSKSDLELALNDGWNIKQVDITDTFANYILEKREEF